MNTKINVIMTCFNRKDKTISCIQSLVNLNNNIDFKFIVVDDNSKDGTKQALSQLNYDIKIIEGDGNLYWNGGMYKGIEYVLEQNSEYGFTLLVNDDVNFFDGAIEKLLNYFSKLKNDNLVIVGSTCDKNCNLTYGGISFNNKGSLKYKTVNPSQKDLKCDTMNANCVLIPNHIIRKVGNLDPYYMHSMGDFDYGFKIKRLGYDIISSDYFVGICNKNDIKGTWMDPQLSIVESIKAKESIKGLPFKQWFYYLNKNYNVATAIFYSITPYVKIILKSIRGK